MRTTYVVTGASRGIGLAIVEELLKDESNYVIAAVRDRSAQSLQDLRTKYPSGSLESVHLDLDDLASVRHAAVDADDRLRGGLDYLIHCAGVSMQDLTPFEEVSLKLYEEQLRLNTVAPLEVIRSFLSPLRNGGAKKILLLSSGLGSIQNAPNIPGYCESYSVSKAGLNMMARKWGASLSKEGITMILVHPGWVDTDMGNATKEWMAKHFPDFKQISGAQSATGCVNVLREAKLEDAVSFYNWDGSRLPW
ncbi:NAD-binding protein [Fomitopsis schrenkii]|uniref:NAD-binding protein n=1 Tax=Fomitopsis schrenkii TaxID=2126942 RepID=S8DME1_FOMSC|nr:NAD-binding protein [Fomitopsis schrenkii]